MAILYGDTSASLVKSQKGKTQQLVGSGETVNYLYGDAFGMKDYARGGNDVLLGAGNNAENNLFGDARSMYDKSEGGNDLLVGGNGIFVTNFLSGDAEVMYQNSIGGNDTLTGGSSYANDLWGDAAEMYGNSQGGNDALSAGNSPSSYVSGDAYSMFDQSRGGNDVLTGGEAGSFNYLYGDAVRTSSKEVAGGNDILVSGSGNDQMWGDFGEWLAGTPATAFGGDVFRFGLNNGTDTIHDFQQGKDKIDLSLKGITGLGGFAMTASGADLVLSFGDNGSDGQVTVIGVSQLHASDFTFATL